MTTLEIALHATAVALAFLALLVAFFAVGLAKGFVTRAEFLKARKEVADLLGVVEDQAEAFKRFRSKVGMREHRDRQRDDRQEVPDAVRDPEGYRRHLEQKHSAYLTGLKLKQGERTQ